MSYIDYFSKAGGEIGEWVTKPSEFPYVDYSEKMLSFIEEVSQTDLLDTEYLTYLKDHVPPGSWSPKQLESADFRTLKAILTYFVRQERFNEGLWMTAARNGYFLEILLRIRDHIERNST